MPKAKDELGLVIRAAHFAAHKHKDQRRKDAKASPYIHHSMTRWSVAHAAVRVPHLDQGDLVDLGKTLQLQSSCENCRPKHRLLRNHGRH
jgi:hypothetical protein